MKKHFLLLVGVAVFAGMSMMSCKSDKTATADVEEQTEQSEESGDNAIANQMAKDNAQGETSLKERLAEAKVDTAGYQTTASGLMYKEVRPGDGKKPESASAVVKVHYTGKKLDGTVFDSSVERGEPIDFPLNRVIAGWTEGVQLMNVGSKYQFIIPSDLAYGQQGTPGGPIGPNEDLYFEVELLDVQ